MLTFPGTATHACIPGDGNPCLRKCWLQLELLSQQAGACLAAAQLPLDTQRLCVSLTATGPSSEDNLRYTPGVHALPDLAQIRNAQMAVGIMQGLNELVVTCLSPVGHGKPP